MLSASLVIFSAAFCLFALLLDKPQHFFERGGGVVV